MNIEESFNKFYDKFLIENKENFNKIETQRKNAIHERKRNKLIILISEIIIFIAVFIIIGIGSTTANIEEKEDIYALASFCLNLAWIVPMIIALINNKKVKEYDKYAKDLIINPLVTSFCPNLEYYPYGTIAYDEFKNSNFEYCNSFYSSNLIKGSYSSNNILIAKVITEYSYIDYTSSSTGSGYGNYETFDGLFAKIKFEKNFDSEIYIKRKKTLSKKLFDAFVGDIQQVTKSNQEERNLKKNYTELKVDELDNVFKIYTSNVDNTKNILNSEMNKILLDIYNIEQFEITIKGNSIYINFWISGLFSAPPLNKETYDKEIIYKNYKMLYLIFYLMLKFEARL